MNVNYTHIVHYRVVYLSYYRPSLGGRKPYVLISPGYNDNHYYRSMSTCHIMFFVIMKNTVSEGGHRMCVFAGSCPYFIWWSHHVSVYTQKTHSKGKKSMCTSLTALGPWRSKVDSSIIQKRKKIYGRDPRRAGWEGGWVGGEEAGMLDIPIWSQLSHS